MKPDWKRLAARIDDLSLRERAILFAAGSLVIVALAYVALIDPALAEQFDSALRKYRALRDQISSAQIDLDTAQLAFKHRYKIVAPAETPTKPIKPKVPMIVGGGIVAALLLAIAAAIGAELRTDRIMQRWQVQQIALPVLADLRFPPGPSE